MKFHSEDNYFHFNSISELSVLFREKSSKRSRRVHDALACSHAHLLVCSYVLLDGVFKCLHALCAYMFILLCP